MAKKKTKNKKKTLEVLLIASKVKEQIKSADCNTAGDPSKAPTDGFIGLSTRPPNVLGPTAARLYVLTTS